jgi:hypothetical protein
VVIFYVFAMLFIHTFFAAIFWSLVAMPAHPVYLSVTEANINPKTKTLQIATKIFVEDLEQALNAEHKVTLNIGTEQENAQTDAYIMGYITKNLAFSHENKILRYTWRGREIEDDAVWIYVETPKLPKTKMLQVQNTILIAQHNTQLNLVHFVAPKQPKQTLAFRADSETQNIYFK